MGNDSNSNFTDNNNNKNDLYDKKQAKVKVTKNVNNNKLDFANEKKDTKSLVNYIITNIQLNQEYDETIGLGIEHLDKYIDTIFPEYVPKEYVNNVRNQINEIKNVEIGIQNNIKNIFEIIDIDNKNSCYFICSIKKVSETEINIAYKYNTIDVSIKPIEKKSNEIKGQEEYQALIHNEIKKEFKKLNEII